MTVSTTPYYRWASRGDSLQPPFNACSPNLSAIQSYYRRRWGAVNLGCHNQRNVSGGNTLSSHAWGAASDDRFRNRQETIDAMGFLIANSVELGVNTIHDYQTQRMWKPGQGWVSAGIGSVGGTWIHVETTPAMFGDGRPVEDRLGGTPDNTGDEDFMTPQDEQWLRDNVGKLVWWYALKNFADGSAPGAGDLLGFAHVEANSADAKLDALSVRLEQLIAALQATGEILAADIEAADTE